MDTDTFTSRTPCEDKGRDQVVFPQAKECQRSPANHQKLGKRHGTNFPLQTSEEINSIEPLISDFLSPALSYVVPVTQLIVLCYKSLRRPAGGNRLKRQSKTVS